MFRRDLVSLAAVTVLALAAGVGCDDSKPEVKPAATSTAKPATTGAATAKATATAAAPTATAAAAATGNGTIKGVVNFTGKPVEMKVPAKRKDAEFCKDKQVPYNAVLVKDGKLQDVFVRLANGSVKGTFDTSKPAHMDQVDCMYTPRIQGVVAGQTIDIKNSDGTLHNVHTYKGAESWFNQAQPKGSDALSKESPEDPTIVKFSCDVHPWMRGFVIVTDHPFFAVSGADGSFSLDKIPAGKYKIEAWHTTYGLKTADVEVADGKPAEVTFSFDGTEAEPAENKDELKGLW